MADHPKIRRFLKSLVPRRPSREVTKTDPVGSAADASPGVHSGRQYVIRSDRTADASSFEDPDDKARGPRSRIAKLTSLTGRERFVGRVEKVFAARQDFDDEFTDVAEVTLHPDAVAAKAAKAKSEVAANDDDKTPTDQAPTDWLK